MISSAMMQRIGLVLVSVGFALALGGVAVLLTLGPRAELVAPVALAGFAAVAAILGGARLLERDPMGF